jgi:hypothetical protein
LSVNVKNADAQAWTDAARRTATVPALRLANAAHAPITTMADTT